MQVSWRKLQMMQEEDKRRQALQLPARTQSGYHKIGAGREAGGAGGGGASAAGAQPAADGQAVGQDSVNSGGAGAGADSSGAGFLHFDASVNEVDIEALLHDSPLFHRQLNALDEDIQKVGRVGLPSPRIQQVVGAGKRARLCTLPLARWYRAH